MEEFYFGNIGLENNFPVRGNSICWDCDTNITALSCQNEIQMKDPFYSTPAQYIRLEEKKLNSFGKVGQVFRPHSVSKTNIVNDPYVLSPELNFRSTTHFVEHIKFSPLFFNRKFLTVLTNDGISRVFEKSKSSNEFRIIVDLHPILMRQTYGLPTQDVTRMTSEDPLKNSTISGFRKWSYISPDVKPKIERNLTHVNNLRREREETYGHPYFDKHGTFIHHQTRKRRGRPSKKKKKKKKNRRVVRKRGGKKRKRKRKKKMKDEDEEEIDESLIIDSGEYISDENQVTEAEIHDLTKYMYNSYCKQISQFDLEKEHKKSAKQRWLVFPMVANKRKYVDFVNDMWNEYGLAKTINKRREFDDAVLNKEIRSRIRYYLRQGHPPPAEYEDLPLEVLQKNLCVEKSLRKKRVFRNSNNDETSSDDEVAEESDEDEDVPTTSSSSGSSDEDTNRRDLGGGMVTLTAGKSWGVKEREGLSKKEREKSGNLMSSILFPSKLDCANTTCSEWCGYYPVQRITQKKKVNKKKKRGRPRKKKKKIKKMVDEDEEEEEEEITPQEEEQEQELEVEIQKGGIVAFHLLGTRSGMVSLMACLVPSPRPPIGPPSNVSMLNELLLGQKEEKSAKTKPKFKFLKYFKVHESRVVAMHWSSHGRPPFLVTSSSHGSIRIWNLSITKKKQDGDDSNIPFEKLDPSYVTVELKLKCEVFQKDGIPSRILETETTRSGVKLVFPKGNTLIIVTLTPDGDRVSRGLYRSHKGGITGLVLRQNYLGELDAFSTSYDGVLVQWRFFKPSSGNNNTNQNNQQEQEPSTMNDEDEEETKSGNPSFDRVVLLDESRKECYYWGLCWSANKTHVMVTCEENMQQMRLKRLTRRNVWKLVPVASQSHEDFIATCLNLRRETRRLGDLMRLVEKQVGDERFMRFADRCDQLCLQRGDYWYNRLVFTILQNLKNRFDGIPVMRDLRTRLNFLLRYMHISFIMHRFLQQPQNTSSRLINLADWILSYHKEIFSLSNRGKMMRNQGFEVMYVRDLKLILQTVYGPNRTQQRSSICDCIGQLLRFYEPQNKGPDHHQQQQRDNTQMLIPFESKEKCPICGEVNPSQCENLFVDGNHCKCSKGHYYDRDVLTFRVIDAVVGVKKCRYCDSKTMENTESCPVCVGVLYSNERELFQKYC